MEEKLNDAVPLPTLIRLLAKEKRDLQLENLDLKHEIAILKEDNEALKQYANNVACGTTTKDLNKLLNVMNNLWSQVAKKTEPMRELVAKTDELKEALEDFVKHLEK